MEKDIYMCYRTVRADNFLKDIQYKVLHRILATNKYLFKIGKAESPQCSFCHTYVESIEHLLFQCNVVYNFWLQIFTKWNAIHDIVELTEKCIILGQSSNHLQESFHKALNVVILLGKNYIWTCKQDGKNIVVTQFLRGLCRHISVYENCVQVKNCITMLFTETD